MNKLAYMILPLALFAASCKTVDDVPAGVQSVRMPDLPAPLDRKADRLPDITDRTMGGLVVDGDATDRAYNDVAHNNNNLIDFYKCVQEAINNEQPLEKCLTVEETDATVTQ